MKKSIQILAAAAAVQIILVVVFNLGGNKLGTQEASSALLNFDKSAVDRIVIQGNENNAAVELLKRGGKWLTAADFPAQQGKVEALLDKLAELKFGLPVATSSGAMQRFKVADDNFERHVLLQQDGDKLAELYLGTGAGARQSHARSVEQKAVYRVGIGSYDLSDKLADWEDKTILQVARDEVRAIEFDGLKLTAVEDEGDAETDKAAAPQVRIWQADTLEDGKALDQKAIDAVLDSLASLRFSEVLGIEAKTDYGLEKPELQFSLERKDGKRSYQFGKLKGADDYVLKVSDRDEYFKIASFTAKSLNEKFSKDKWLMDEPVSLEVDTSATTNGGEENGIALPEDVSITADPPEQE